MIRKNIFRGIMLSVLGSLVLVGGFPQEGIAQRVFWKMGTAGSGGVFYFLGSGIANVVTKYVKEVKLTSEGTAGGTENLRRMTHGELELAIISPWDLTNTLKDGTAKREKLCLLCAGHSSCGYFIARKSSGWKTMKEAIHKGVKISTGEPGSGVQISVQFFLNAFGLTLKDVESHPISFNEAGEALKDGRIDVTYQGSGIPTAAVSNITQSIEAVILEFTEDDISRLHKIAPAMTGRILPAKTYRGQDKDILTSSYRSMLMVRSDLNPELVYAVIKAMYEHPNEIAQIHPAGKEINIERVYGDVGAEFSYGMGVKFHPGVIKYLKEQNRWDKKYD